MTPRPAGAPSRRSVLAWGLWNAGAAAYHTVVLTFVFSVYLTGTVGRNLPGPVDAAAWLGYAVGAAGLLVALTAPVIGHRADATGRRKRSTLVWTALTVASMAALFAVRADWHWLALGLVLLGLGSFSAELAAVSSNAMLRGLSTPATIGRVSGFGWSMSHVGGVVLLIAVYSGLIAGGGGLVGAPTDDGYNIRLVALVAAVWFAVLAVPMAVAVPEAAPTGGAADRPEGVGPYRALLNDLRELSTGNRSVLLFLGASALYRDGLAAIAAFGGVLAVTVYGLGPADVLVFGIVASVTAAAGALLGGVLEDRVGPKAVVLGSLVGLLGASVVLAVASGPVLFWIFGLVIGFFEGPTQASSRAFLARLAPADREGRLFGLYAASGRAASFLAPTLFGLMITLTGVPRAGIVGILVVLAAGTLALLPVPAPRPALRSRRVSSGRRG